MKLRFLILALLILPGCQRGRPHEKPPVHIIQDMYEQPKYLPQDFSEFFADGSALRPPVPGTVARGRLDQDSLYYTGIDPATGQEAAKDPLPMTLANLKRGQSRFDIYCTPCHGYLADGNGIMGKKGFVPPPSFHIDRLRQAPDGHFFKIMRDGSAIMPSYAQQIPARDRWTIVLYIRALQVSQNPTQIDSIYAVRP